MGLPTVEGRDGHRGRVKLAATKPNSRCINERLPGRYSGLNWHQGRPRKKLTKQPDLAALCDMADQAGCSIADLLNRLSAYELNLRLTNRRNKAGETFVAEKIVEIQHQKQMQKRDEVLSRAPWSKKP